MKKLLFLFLLVTFYSHSQTYNYTLKEEYIDGQLFKKDKGNFQLKFEIADNKPLFTIYHNNIEQGWLAFIESQGASKRGDVVFSKDLYFDTRIDKGSLVLMDSSRNRVVIFWGRNRTEYIK